MKVKFKIDPVVKDGKTYGKISKHKSLLNTSRLSLNLENLFNGNCCIKFNFIVKSVISGNINKNPPNFSTGNKALGDNMNNFMNENWKIIFQELKPAISGALGKIIRDILENVFMTVSYEDLFLQS